MRDDVVCRCETCGTVGRVDVDDSAPERLAFFISGLDGSVLCETCWWFPGGGYDVTRIDGERAVLP